MSAEPDGAPKRPTIKPVPISSLTPHPRNPREGDVGAIIESIKAFGQFRPIVVQEKTPDGEPRMIVVAGTHTYLAASQLGFTKIDAALLTLTDEDALRIMLADNRTHDLGRDKMDVLAEVLADLGVDGMVGTGFDGESLDTILRDLGQYDPGASILNEFAGISEGLSERAELMKGRDQHGNEFFAFHVSLTAVQRKALLDAFKKAKDAGFATQPEALEAMARAYTEDKR